ncbi:ABC transporter ATP-binding protein [Streptomyces sp. NL15-2K]|nr:ABC transporter ATP-binding protein [Streptomyces sp. NL15-2K]
MRLLAGEEQPQAGSVDAAGTVGHLAQERDRRTGESLRGYLARRTGVGAAEEALEEASQSLAEVWVWPCSSTGRRTC